MRKQENQADGIQVQQDQLIPNVRDLEKKCVTYSTFSFLQKTAFPAKSTQTENATPPPPRLTTVPKAHGHGLVAVKAPYLLEQARNGQRLQALVDPDGLVGGNVDPSVRPHRQGRSNRVFGGLGPDGHGDDLTRRLLLLGEAAEDNASLDA